MLSNRKSIGAGGIVVMPETDVASSEGIKIFISHSSVDKAFVELITEMLINSLNVTERNIRCTSVRGFRLQGGAWTSTQLKKEIQNCKVLIGVFTQNSMESLYVMFELGAAWGLEKRIVPICGPGFTFTDLRPPISETHAIKWNSREDLEQLIDELAEVLQVATKPLTRVSSFIDKVISYRHP